MRIDPVSGGACIQSRSIGLAPRGFFGVPVKLLATLVCAAILTTVIGCDHDVREPGQPRVQLNAPSQQVDHLCEVNTIKIQPIKSDF